jgi:hypothetical protein
MDNKIFMARLSYMAFRISRVLCKGYGGREDGIYRVGYVKILPAWFTRLCEGNLYNFVEEKMFLPCNPNVL